MIIFLETTPGYTLKRGRGMKESGKGHIYILKIDHTSSLTFRKR
jgi:hypothetical protein